MKHLCYCLVAFAIVASVHAAPKKPKPTLYVPMDYSTCGYHASEQPLPSVAVAVYVAWRDGDCSALIQQAIDEVSRRKSDANGHRGAVLLGEGTFRIDTPLRITASGVVLRGMGRERTRLVKHGVDRGALLYIEGQRPMGVPSDTVSVAASIVPAGSTAISILLSLLFAIQALSLLALASMTSLLPSERTGITAPAQERPRMRVSAVPLQTS